MTPEIWAMLNNLNQTARKGNVSYAHLRQELNEVLYPLGFICCEHTNYGDTGRLPVQFCILIDESTKGVRP